MDYKIKVGVELDQNGIDKAVNGYSGNVKVGVDQSHLKNSIDTVVRGYSTSEQVKIGATLITEDITKKITSLNAENKRKKLKVKIEPDFTGFDKAVRDYSKRSIATGAKSDAKTFKIKVELNPSGIEGQIKTIANSEAVKSAKISLNAELNKVAISEAVKDFNAAINKADDVAKISVGVDPDFTGLDKKISGYTAGELKVRPVVLKKDLIADLASFQKEDTSNYIFLKARLVDNAVQSALNEYKSKFPDRVKFPVDLTLNSAKEIDDKINTYKTKPIEVPVTLKPAESGFKDKISNIKIPVTAELTNAEVITNAIEGYQNKPLPVKAKLIPAQGFASELTKTPIPINAKLSEGAIAELNTAITNPSKALAKLPLGATLKKDAKELNPEVTALSGLVTEKLTVGVKLDKDNINADIDLFQPTATLGIKPDLIIEDVDDQIRAYIPKEKIKVHLDLLDSDINKKTGEQNAQEPITVNVKLDQQSINNEIKAFDPATNSKLRVGVNLDFKSHKDKETKEYLQKSINKQIKDFKADAKVKVGVELDKSDIETQIGAIETNNPLNLEVKLEPNSVQNVEKQIANLKQQLQDIGNIGVNIGGNGVGTGTVDGRGQDIQTVRIARGVDDVTRAYRELLSIQNRMGSKQQAVAKLDTTKNQQEILELSNQIDKLARKYQRIHQLFSGQFSSAQIDALNRNFEITAEKLSIIKQKALDAKAGLDKSGTKGTTKKQVDETTQAFRDLMGVLNELNSKRLQLNGLSASSPESSNKIQTLRLQIEQLDNEYNNLLRSFSVQGIQFTADQWNQLETAMARVGRQIDVVQAGMSDKSAIQSQTQAYKELLSISKEIGSLEINIAKLKNQGGNANQIEALENQLRTLQNTYRQLVTDMNTQLTADQWSSIYTQIAKTSEALEKLKAKYADTQAKTAEKLMMSGSIADSTAKFDKAKNGFEQLTNASEKTVLSFNQLNASYTQLTTAQTNYRTVMSNATSTDEQKLQAMYDLIAANDTYQNDLKTTNILINESNRLQKEAIDDASFETQKEAALVKVKSLFQEGSEAARQFGERAKQLEAELKSCGKADLGNVVDKVKVLGQEVKNSHLQTKKWSTGIKEQFDRYKNYFSVASVFMYVGQALRSMFEQVKMIDSAMTELKKVTNETDESYNRFLTNAASRAKELGTTIDGLVESTAAFARLGYGFEDSQELAEVANIYAVVGDEIESVEAATESLVSTLAAFKQEMGDMSDSDFAMSIVDKMNEVANNYSISSGGLGEALQRSASSMAAANNSLDETIAMITAANEVAQNPEKVGNAMKTKFLYNCLNVQKCA